MSWYWNEVRGNVLAIVPCAFLAWLWLRSKHTALHEAHRALSVQHSQTHAKLLELIDAMDSDTEGGVGPVVVEIRDSLDAHVPGGVSGLINEVDRKVSKIGTVYR